MILPNHDLYYNRSYDPQSILYNPHILGLRLVSRSHYHMKSPWVTNPVGGLASGLRLNYSGSLWSALIISDNI